VSVFSVTFFTQMSLLKLRSDLVPAGIGFFVLVFSLCFWLTSGQVSLSCVYVLLNVVAVVSFSLLFLHTGLLV
jgi:hypothetical protein